MWPTLLGTKSWEIRQLEREQRKQKMKELEQQQQLDLQQQQRQQQQQQQPPATHQHPRDVVNSNIDGHGEHSRPGGLQWRGRDNSVPRATGVHSGSSRPTDSSSSSSSGSPPSLSSLPIQTAAQQQHQAQTLAPPTPFADVIVGQEAQAHSHPQAQLDPFFDQLCDLLTGPTAVVTPQEQVQPAASTFSDRSRSPSWAPSTPTRPRLPTVPGSQPGSPTKRKRETISEIDVERSPKRRRLNGRRINSLPNRRFAAVAARPRIILRLPNPNALASNPANNPVLTQPLKIRLTVARRPQPSSTTSSSAAIASSTRPSRPRLILRIPSGPCPNIQELTQRRSPERRPVDANNKPDAARSTRTSTNRSSSPRSGSLADDESTLSHPSTPSSSSTSSSIDTPCPSPKPSSGAALNGAGAGKVKSRPRITLKLTLKPTGVIKPTNGNQPRTRTRTGPPRRPPAPAPTSHAYTGPTTRARARTQESERGPVTRARARAMRAEMVNYRV
ncbi:hypothetical protein LTR93_002232 [Exophiala xenobiotica]|nr:hypothetical protein LTR93_002232 [Exophiala xenobiotica]